MKNKKWQIFPVRPDDKEAYSAYSDLTAQLLYNRGLESEEAIRDFLEPDRKKVFHDPFLFEKMEEAVSIIIKHIKAGNLICVFGDYDADGVTSAALLSEVLSFLRAKAEVYIPHRVTEGYGMNKKAIKYIAAMGAKLIISVDNGIRNKAEVALAKELGIEVVLTDHHIPPEDKADYPDCPIINPAIENEPYPFHFLVGVGVAYKLAVALIRKSKIAQADKEKLENDLLDLAAIGTVADCAKLVGENRALTKFGLSVLDRTKRLGLRELIKISSLKNQDQLDAWNIGFQIGPRLNAAGRLAHANTAYQLLVSKNQAEAASLAGQLDQRNQLRQKHTMDLFEAVEAQVAGQKGNCLLIGICPENATDNPDDWNEGVIGLVSGRLTQKYHLPSLVYTKTGKGWKASGRSIDSFNLIEAIEANSDLLDKFGGHPAACGVSISQDNLDVFNKRLVDFANEKLGGRLGEETLKIEALLDLAEVDEDLVMSVKNFSPFGSGNPRPVLASRNLQVLDVRFMGTENQHIKFRLKSENSKAFSALAFSEAEKWQEIKIGDKIDLAYYLEMNEFNGRKEEQLKIVDIKINEK